jgi:hypothetical protein
VVVPSLGQQLAYLEPLRSQIQQCHSGELVAAHPPAFDCKIEDADTVGLYDPLWRGDFRMFLTTETRLLVGRRPFAYTLLEREDDVECS